MFGLVGENQNKLRVYDGFNRADGAIGNADTGQAWTVTGTWGIANGEAYSISVGESVNAVINAGISDGILTVKLPAIDKGAERIIFRWLNAGNRISVWVDTNKYSLYKHVGGIETLLGSYSVVPRNGDIITIEANGSLIKIYLNDLKILEIIESANIANTNWGFGTYHSNIPRFDSFKVEAI